MIYEEYYDDEDDEDDEEIIIDEEEEILEDDDDEEIIIEDQFASIKAALMADHKAMNATGKPKTAKKKQKSVVEEEVVEEEEILEEEEIIIEDEEVVVEDIEEVIVEDDFASIKAKLLAEHKALNKPKKATPRVQEVEVIEDEIVEDNDEEVLDEEEIVEEEEEEEVIVEDDNLASIKAKLLAGHKELNMPKKKAKPPPQVEEEVIEDEEEEVVEEEEIIEEEQPDNLAAMKAKLLAEHKALNKPKKAATKSTKEEVVDEEIIEEEEVIVQEEPANPFAALKAALLAEQKALSEKINKHKAKRDAEMDDMSVESEYEEHVIEKWFGRDVEPDDLEEACMAMIPIVYKGQDVDPETMMRRTPLPELYKYLKQHKDYIYMKKAEAGNEEEEVIEKQASLKDLFANKAKAFQKPSEQPKRASSFVEEIVEDDDDEQEYLDETEVAEEEDEIGDGVAGPEIVKQIYDSSQSELTGYDGDEALEEHVVDEGSDEEDIFASIKASLLAEYHERKEGTVQRQSLIQELHDSFVSLGSLVSETEVYDEELEEEIVEEEDEYEEQIIEKWFGRDAMPDDLHEACLAMIPIVYKGQNVDPETMMRRTPLPELYKYLKQHVDYKDLKKEMGDEDVEFVGVQQTVEDVLISRMSQSQGAKKYLDNEENLDDEEFYEGDQDATFQKQDKANKAGSRKKSRGDKMAKTKSTSESGADDSAKRSPSKKKPGKLDLGKFKTSGESVFEEKAWTSPLERSPGRLNTTEIKSAGTDKSKADGGGKESDESAKAVRKKKPGRLDVSKFKVTPNEADVIKSPTKLFIKNKAGSSEIAEKNLGEVEKSGGAVGHSAFKSPVKHKPGSLKSVNIESSDEKSNVDSTIKAPSASVKKPGKLDLTKFKASKDPVKIGPESSGRQDPKDLVRNKPGRLPTIKLKAAGLDPSKAKTNEENGDNPIAKTPAKKKPGRLDTSKFGAPKGDSRGSSRSPKLSSFKHKPGSARVAKAKGDNEQSEETGGISVDSVFKPSRLKKHKPTSFRVANPKTGSENIKLRSSSTQDEPEIKGNGVDSKKDENSSGQNPKSLRKKTPGRLGDRGKFGLPKPDVSKDAEGAGTGLGDEKAPPKKKPGRLNVAKFQPTKGDTEVTSGESKPVPRTRRRSRINKGIFEKPASDQEGENVEAKADLSNEQPTTPTKKRPNKVKIPKFKESSKESVDVDNKPASGSRRKIPSRLGGRAKSEDSKTATTTTSGETEGEEKPRVSSKRPPGKLNLAKFQSANKDEAPIPEGESKPGSKSKRLDKGKFEVAKPSSGKKGGGVDATADKSDDKSTKGSKKKPGKLGKGKFEVSKPSSGKKSKEAGAETEVSALGRGLKQAGKLNITKFQSAEKGAIASDEKSAASEERLEDQIARSFKKKKPGRLDVGKFETAKPASNSERKKSESKNRKAEVMEAPAPTKKPGKLNLAKLQNFK